MDRAEHKGSSGKFSLRTLTIGLVGLLLLAGSLGVGATVWVNHRVTETQDRWQAYRDASSVRARSLIEITDRLGYGGAIHHLLNYVLRGDQLYLEQFSDDLGAIRAAVDRYRTIDTTGKEKAALREIEDLVEVLDKRVELAQVMRAYGSSPKETTRSMSLWAPGALIALDDLHQAVEDRRSLHSTEKTKLELIREFRRDLGFGGMIEFYKKLVLLGDTAFAPMALRAAELARNALDQYRALPLNADEDEALRAIDDTLYHYEFNVEIALSMAKGGAPARAIDAAVIIDDQPALTALSQLERSVAWDANQLVETIDENLVLVSRLTDMLVVIIAVGAVVVGVVIVGVVLISVQRPLSRIADAMVRIPEGELTAIGNVESRVREVANLAESLDVFRRYASELDRTSDILHQFHALSTDVSLSIDERITKILQLGVDHFGTDLGTASCTSSGQYVVEYSVGSGATRKPGTAFDLETTYCSHMLSQGRALAFHNIAESELAEALCYRTFGRNCYIGAPVIVEGEVYGTINFSSMDARDHPFSKSELVLVEMMGRWLGMELERVRAMERIEAARDAAEAGTRAKSSFLANMSHEIRTPLNGVIGLSRLLAQTSLNQKQRDYVRKVLFSSENLLGIINDILDFSKIEAGQLSIEKTEFRLLDVIEGVTAIVAPRAAEKNLEFLVSVDPNAPQDLVGDPLRLGQILTNLCTNAIKFTEEGEVLVSIQATEVVNGSVELHFAVRDTGLGMTPEQVDQIFRPFTQADVSTTRKFGGTGLGLTISKEFTERMDGRIWVESEHGVGSTFQFTVRLALGTSGETLHTIVTSDLRDLRILVVDDNEMARLVIGDTLRAMGFDVDVAASGPAALRRVSVDEGVLSYDVVLMDWMMPGLDGIETADKIREACGTGPYPATILVSAYMPDEGMMAAATPALAGFVSKPVNQSTLFDAIASAVGAKSGGRLTRAQEAVRSRTSLSGLVVLLAEDNEINQEVAVSVLEQQGVTVVVANNGQEAIDVLSAPDAQQFDAVLMDVQMPVMDGLEATRRIKGDDRLAALPVIAMTAHALEEERDKCFAAGMCDHVAKPLDEEKLFDALARHCRPGDDENPDVPAKLEPSPSAPSAPVATLIVNIDNLTTIDTVSLRRSLPDDSLTSRLLLKFREGQSDSADSIRAAITAGDRDKARRMAHQVRGVAGNLRAMEVLETAKALELKIDQDGLEDAAALTPIVDAFAMALDALLADIEAASWEETVVSPGEEAAQASAADIRTLVDQLRSGDMDAEDTWNALQPGLQARDGALAADVAVSIDELDYDAAAAKLESILSTV
ncbi:MAG: response regulator [Thalassobaculaceae bacterium]|nr:response regulator [Thalassobaculaceae bacterium]